MLTAVSVALLATTVHAAPAAGSMTVPAGAEVTVKEHTALINLNGETGTFQCLCEGGGGACQLTRASTVLICSSSGGPGSCKPDNCLITTTTTTATSSPALTAAPGRAAAVLGTHDR